MNAFDTNTKRKECLGKINDIFIWTAICIFSFRILITPAFGQPVLFDFNNAPLHSSLPMDLSVNGITAHFSATGQGYSIQDANVLGFTPSGFDGRCIYPNSIFLSDLLISFDHTLTDFSILYACQELGCDDAATMRVTARMNGTFIGTTTKTASNPGTWPADTLSCRFIQGFNSVIVHYDHRPPTCQDYGVIFMADNMQVTSLDIPITLFLKLYIEGFYSGNGMMAAVADPINDPYLCDYITIELRDVNSPNDVVYTMPGTLDIYGNAAVVFPGNIFGSSYYIAVHHRNSLETWSKIPVYFNSSSVTFDFTTP
jgi:hypothetical protein